MSDSIYLCSSSCLILYVHTTLQNALLTLCWTVNLYCLRRGNFISPMLWGWQPDFNLEIQVSFKKIQNLANCTAQMHHYNMALHSQ